MGGRRMNRKHLKLIYNTIDMPKAANTAIPFTTLLDEIKSGEIRIPEFQRASVWSSEDVETLLDSIKEEYPIGIFLIWQTKESMKERDPLNLNLPVLPEGAIRKYLLDGQQRTIALVGSFIGNLPLKEPHKAFYDLKEMEFKVIKKADIDRKKVEIKDSYLPLEKLFVKNSKHEYDINNELIEKYSGSSLNTINHLFLTFSSLEIPTVIESKSLDVACKIFERLNNTGVKLSVVDLMVAKTYKANFNLRERLDELATKYTPKGFNISGISILQAMASCLVESPSRDAIIDNSDDIRNKWNKTSAALDRAIDFLITQNIVPVAKFLPNEIMFSPLTYFFYKKGTASLSNHEIKVLKRYVWLTGLSNRYVQGQATQVKQDIKKLENLLDNPNAEPFREKLNIDREMIMSTELDFNYSVSKTILCILASNKPLDFKSGQTVPLSDTFSKADSNSMHHIFPRKAIRTLYEGKSNYESGIKPFVNSIANISMISLEANQEIAEKKPSVYFKNFEKNNPDLKSALDSQLIGDLKDFGIMNDNFPKFLKKRSEAIARLINKIVGELNA